MVFLGIGWAGGANAPTKALQKHELQIAGDLK
jgi:hypothetical protein